MVIVEQLSNIDKWFYQLVKKRVILIRITYVIQPDKMKTTHIPNCNQWPSLIINFTYNQFKIGSII